MAIIMIEESRGKKENKRESYVKKERRNNKRERPIPKGKGIGKGTKGMIEMPKWKRIEGREAKKGQYRSKREKRASWSDRILLDNQILYEGIP